MKFWLTIFVAFYFFVSACSTQKMTDVSSNGNMKIVINKLQNPLLPDTNYHIYLYDLSENTEREIWISPDEEKTSEFRAIWSNDGQKVLVVGKNLFFRNKNLKLQNGDVLYFLFDTNTNQKWCNCNDSREISLDYEVLKANGFTIQ